MNVLLICAMLGLYFFGCNKVSDKDWQKTTKIVYVHSDGTIAPEIYRNYTITVTETEVVVDIRNYDKSLLTKSFHHTANNYKAFVGQLQQLGIAKGKETDFPAGGSTESLRLYKGDRQYFSAYETGGSGTLRVSNGSLRAVMNELVPDIDSMVEQTRPKMK